MTTASPVPIETASLAAAPLVPLLEPRRDLGIAALIVAAAMAIMFDAWKDIYRLGKADEELSYVLLAPVMIIWLAWVVPLGAAEAGIRWSRACRPGKASALA